MSDFSFSKKWQESLQFFRNGNTKPLAARQDALATLEVIIKENIEDFCQALYQDLKKPEQESLMSLMTVLDELKLAQKKLGQWIRPQKKSSTLMMWPSLSQLHYEPKGVVLIIAPWNYPVYLVFAPLVAALAAGNCVFIKPSELAPATSALINRLLSQHFSSPLVSVVEGGVEEATELLQIKFDHIFFTGSTSVGKKVMQAAAKNLVPVTLELGGKSPTLVCEDGDLDLAARRIVWGKFFNAGQTCVAPDYIYVHKKVHKPFVEKLKKEVAQQFGDSPQSRTHYARIINLKNLERLEKLIDPQKQILGGESDHGDLYMAPTLMSDVNWQDPVMQEEIFGPILPILEYDNWQDVLSEIGQRPKPLAAYLFTQSKQKQKQFVQELSFGGGCINDVIVHLGNPQLPFGGVGDSGMGHYHGYYGFKELSHAKSVVYRGRWFDFSLRYPPYGHRGVAFLKWLLRR